MHTGVGDLSAGEAALRGRPARERNEQIKRLEAKVGQVTMDNELLREKISRMQAGNPLQRTRPRRYATASWPQRVAASVGAGYVGYEIWFGLEAASKMSLRGYIFLLAQSYGRS